MSGKRRKAKTMGHTKQTPRSQPQASDSDQSPAPYVHHDSPMILANQAQQTTRRGQQAAAAKRNRFTAQQLLRQHHCYNSLAG